MALSDADGVHGVTNLVRKQEQALKAQKLGLRLRMRLLPDQPGVQSDHAHVRRCMLPVVTGLLIAAIWSIIGTTKYHDAQYAG